MATTVISLVVREMDMRRSRMIPKAGVLMVMATAWMLSASSLLAATNTWDGDTDGDWGVAANWDAAPTFAAGNDFVFHAVGAGNLNTFLGDAARTIGGLTFNDNADSAITVRTYSNGTGSGGVNRIVTFDNGAGDAWIRVAAGATGDISIAPGGGRIAFRSNFVIDHNGSGMLTFGNWLDDGATTSSITKNGTGTLTFGSTLSHPYDGGLILNAGRIRAGSTGPFGTGLFVMTGGTLSSTSASGFNITNSYNFSNSLTLGDATDSGSINFTAAATGTLKGNTILNTVSDVTLGGAIGEDGGSFSLTKTGAGTLTLGNNANTFSGGLAINEGTVSTGNADGRLGATGGALSFDGGTLLWAGGINAGVSRDTTLNSGGGTIGVQSASVEITWNNTITGVGGLTKTGDGILYSAAGSHTFQGGLNLNGGIFSVANGDNRLGAGDGSVSFDGGTLRFHGSGVDMTTSDRTTTLNAGGGAIDVQFADRMITWAGVVGGAGDFTKIGAGTLRLIGDNDYTGTTTVSNGTLLVNGTHTGGGQYTIASGATLGGTGLIDAAIGVMDGGIVAPGNSPGILTVGSNFTFSSTSTGLFELGGTGRGTQYDALVVDETLTLDGNIVVTLISGFNPSAGDSFDLLDWGSLVDNGYNLVLPGLDAGLAWETSGFGTEGTLLVIPEPSTVGLLGLGAVVMLGVVRRGGRGHRPSRLRA